MLIVDPDKLMTFARLAPHVPSRSGRPPHVSTIHRWASGGVRGVRLESVLVGGVRMTSLEAFQRFVNRLSGGESTK